MKTLISSMMNLNNSGIESDNNPEFTANYTPVAEKVNPIGSDFIFAGSAIFTVKPSDKYTAANGTKPHYTFKVTKKEGMYNGRPQVTYFAALLTGPDNDSDYSYIGILRSSNGTLQLTKASKYGEQSPPVKILERVAIALIEGRGEQITNAGWSIHHEGKCGRCARTLTTPESVERGIGPECWSKMNGG